MAGYNWVSVWDIGAPRPAVWAAISRPEDWPRWWRFVDTVELLRPGDADGVGAARRLVWRTRLPYRIRLEVITLAVDPERLLRVQALGDAAGEGTWRFADTGAGTRVEYEWRIRMDCPWMRRLAPLAAPLYRWNHDAVMAAGGIGLAHYLAGGNS
jgi:hypothetical protein